MVGGAELFVDAIADALNGWYTNTKPELARVDMRLRVVDQIASSIDRETSSHDPVEVATRAYAGALLARLRSEVEAPPPTSD